MKLLSLEKLKNMKLSDMITTHIVRFRWIAKDDPKTCDYCRSRHGMIIESTDPEYEIYMPPAHPHCRCVWKNITSDEEVIPERSWSKPSESMITRFAPFLFLIPFLGKKEEPIEVIPEEIEIPEPKVNPEQILVINNIENTKEKVKDYLGNNIILLVFIGKRGETILEKEFSIDDSVDFTKREISLVKDKAKSYIMDNTFPNSDEYEYDLKRMFNLKNKF